MLRKIVISHPTGNEFSRVAAMAFLNAGMLDFFYTSVASTPGSFLQKISSYHFFAEINRRSFPPQLSGKIKTHPFKETGRLLLSKLKMQKPVAHESPYFSVDAVYQYLDRFVAKEISKNQQADTVYCYEDGAFFTFQQAKKKKIKCIYDLPIGYWKTMHRIMEVEKEINPAWAETIIGLKDSVKKLKRKDEEIFLADKIFVASKFTQSTLLDYPATLPPVYVVPYGFPPVREKKYTVFKPGQKIKLLFVGGLSQRKGLSYLFEAVEAFSLAISLTVIGKAASYNCKALKENLEKHRWIESSPHEKILEAMALHDILILPSLFEGFGLVITEAMAQGTPVIATERTAAKELITNGENGWLVKAGSADEIKNVLAQIIENPEIIEMTGKNALKTAGERPWSVYGEKIVQAVNDDS